MLCPCCKSLLVDNGLKEFETLCEHVENSNWVNLPLRPRYNCSDLKCKTHEFGIWWNEDGELYSEKYFNNDDIKFINENDAPFNTFERKINVEIYNSGLRKHIYLPSILMLFIFKPYIEFSYKSNENGDVLESNWKLNIFR